MEKLSEYSDNTYLKTLIWRECLEYNGEESTVHKKTACFILWNYRDRSWRANTGLQLFLLTPLLIRWILSQMFKFSSAVFVLLPMGPVSTSPMGEPLLAQQGSPLSSPPESGLVWGGWENPQNSALEWGGAVQPDKLQCLCWWDVYHSVMLNSTLCFTLGKPF